MENKIRVSMKDGNFTVKTHKPVYILTQILTLSLLALLRLCRSRSGVQSSIPVSHVCRIRLLAVTPSQYDFSSWWDIKQLD